MYAEGLRNIWAICRCNYIREVARMVIWPTAEQIGAIRAEVTLGGEKPCYEDLHGEPKKKEEKKLSALEQMQAAQNDDEEDDREGKWVDGHFVRPSQKRTKWNKMTERTEQLDVGTASNEYYATLLSTRQPTAAGKFNQDYKEFCHTMSEENKAAKPPKPDYSALIPDDQDIFIYSSQTLNIAELQKEVIRRKLDKPENDDKFFTYSDEYMSLAMCKVNETQIERDELAQSKARWVDPAG